MMKKLLSVLVVIAMLACMLPVFAVSAQSAANPEVPVAKVDGKTATGAPVGTKTWSNDANGLKNNADKSIFVFDTEFEAGTIEWTMTTNGGDNGIIFGLEGESMDFWENGDRYYFVFANNNTGEMLLAKTGEGLGWCWMKAMPIPNFQKNATVDMKIEYDGDGHIKIYGNGALVYDYCDGKPLTGTRVGLRAGGANVTYTNINITTADKNPDKGIEGGKELPFAKVGDKTLTGYFSGGPWNNDGGKITITDTALTHDSWATTFIIDNDTLPLTDGSLTATVKPGNTNAVDNFLTGIIFGLEAEKNVTVWKNANYTPEYYVLFVSQGRVDDDHIANNVTRLVLAKGGTIVHDDKLTVLAEAKIADGYAYAGNEFATITATFKMVDGKLEITGSLADSDVTLSYVDEDPLTGSRYGFGARCAGSQLTSLVPVNNAPNAPDAPPATDPVDPPVTNPPATDPVDPPVTNDTTDDTTDDAITDDATPDDGADDPADEDSSTLIYIAVAGAVIAAAAVIILVIKKKK